MTNPIRARTSMMVRATPNGSPAGRTTATSTEPTSAVPSDDPRLETLRDKPEISPRVILDPGALSLGHGGQGRVGIMLFPEGGELPQPGPVHDGFRRRDARPVPWHPDAEYAGRDRAGHRRRHHDR